MSRADIKKTDYQLAIIGKIKELRENDNLSQAGLADILGISYGMIGNIESPKLPQKYSLYQIKIVCEKYDVPTEQLFLSEVMPSTPKKELPKILINKIIEYYGEN